MKGFLYWTGATLLVVTLLLTLFLTGDFIAARHWPFHLIWGGFITTLGVLFIVLGRKMPVELWGIRGAPSELDPKLVSKAATLAAIFGLLIALGGIGFALTHRVGVLVVAFVVAVTAVRIALGRFRRRPDNDDHEGPAA